MNRMTIQTTNTYVHALARRPIIPSIGDLIECMDDCFTDKAPCSGPVFAVKNGDVAVGWSDCIEVIRPIWARVYFSPANDKRPAYWRIDRRILS